MNRVTILLDDEVKDWLEREAERCGCKSMSTHLRHRLTEEKERNAK